MELTPNDIRNQKFSSSMRGYNRGEVDTFLDAAATALEEAKVAILKMSEEKDALRRRYEEIRELENTIKDAVIEAQRSGEAMLVNARRDADGIIAEALRRRDEAIDQKNRKLAEADGHLHEMESTLRALYAKLQADLHVFARMVETMDPFKSESERKNTPPPPGTDMDIDHIVEQFRMETGGSEEKRHEQS